MNMMMHSMYSLCICFRPCPTLTLFPLSLTCHLQKGRDLWWCRHKSRRCSRCRTRRRSLVLGQFFLIASPVARGDLPIKVLVLIRQYLPTLANELAERGKVNFAVRLAMATFLGPVPGPLLVQQFFLLGVGPVGVFVVQKAVAFVSEKEVVRTECAERC